jgi:simple sugar transport system ATP-binding protein
MEGDELLRMEAIRKEFPGVVASDDVDFSVRRGEIHGLLGENGAGKSTLMKILYGLYDQDSGTILIDGERLEADSPRDAIDAGIGMVHQHFMLVPRLTVVENIVLGSREPAGPFRAADDAGDGGLLDSLLSSRIVRSLASRFTLGLESPAEEIRTLADAYGFDIDVTASIWELDIGQQQRVEILKALYRDVDLLILDEPTAVLTPTEADRLFDTLRQLADEGLSVIFITHKLTEVTALTDRVTVLRDGKGIETVETADCSRADLAELMVGREVLFDIEKESVATGRPVLEVSDLVVEDDRGIEAVTGADLSVEEGEIVGIAGVSGNGQRELAEALVGVRPAAAGSITVGERELTGESARRFIEAGVSFVPEDRDKHGAAGDLSVMHNAIMKQFRNDRFGEGVRLDYDAARKYAETLVEEFDVRGVDDITETAAGDLSGGNLQKLILARELYREPTLLVANQPTRGVDVGAIEFIRDELLAQREAGTGILLLSEDLDEIFDLSDRVLVVYEGEIVHKTTPENADKNHLSLLMNGGQTTDGEKGDEPPTQAAVQRGDA